MLKAQVESGNLEIMWEKTLVACLWDFTWLQKNISEDSQFLVSEGNLWTTVYRVIYTTLQSFIYIMIIIMGK
jgi:hypothetical protein